MGTPSYQTLFNKAWQGVIGQGKKSETKSGFCEYIQDDGARCNLGWCVSEAKANSFKTAGEGLGVNEIIHCGVAPNWMQDKNYFLQLLQMAHDEPIPGTDYINRYKKLMIELAKEYNLKMPDSV